MCRITGGRAARAGTDPVDGNVIGIRQRSPPRAVYGAHVSFTYFTTSALNLLPLAFGGFVCLFVFS